MAFLVGTGAGLLVEHTSVGELGCAYEVNHDILCHESGHKCEICSVILLLHLFIEHI